MSSAANDLGQAFEDEWKAESAANAVRKIRYTYILRGVGSSTMKEHVLKDAVHARATGQQHCFSAAALHFEKTVGEVNCR